MIRIIDEPPAAAAAVEALLDRAFGPGRRLKTAERLRDGRRPAPGLALAALATGADRGADRPALATGADRGTDRLLGTLRLWPIRAAGGQPLLLLGPLAVDADAQGAGLGGRLVVAGLIRARRQGHGAVVLVGDAAYYRRFGFTPQPTRALDLPGPVDRRRFLGLDLVPGTLARASGLLTADGAAAALAAAA